MSQHFCGVVLLVLATLHVVSSQTAVTCVDVTVTCPVNSACIPVLSTFCLCTSGYVTSADGLGCDYDCGALTAPTNGQLSSPDGFIEDAVVTYSCDAGYALTGNTQRTCDAGILAWTGTDPTCDDCGSIPPSAVTAGSASTPTSTTYLSTADVICDTGYTTTTLLIECLASGLWSQAVCDIVDCGSIPPSAVTAGSASTPTSTTYLSTADVICDTGNTTTTLLIECLASGLWSQAVCDIVDDDECCDGGTVIVRTMIFVVLLMVAAIILVLSW